MANSYTWTAADGTSLDLSDQSSGYIVTKDGTAGFFSPSYDLVADEYAGIDGATVQAIRAAPAEPTLGLYVSASSPTEFRQKLRGLVRTMRPKAGPGTLTVRNETGEARNLDCYCRGGMEGAEARFSAWVTAVLRFYAPDPWWYGDERSVDVGLGAGTAFFPIFPLTLAPSNVQGQFTIDLSDTDAPTYPTWTITGPGSTLVLTNTTTGRSIQVNTTLNPGDTMVITTSPGAQSVRRGDGTNLMGSVTGDPALWPLIEDVNTVTATLTGATTDSHISGVYRPRYAGI